MKVLRGNERSSSFGKKTGTRCMAGIGIFVLVSLLFAADTLVTPPPLADSAKLSAKFDSVRQILKNPAIPGQSTQVSSLIVSNKDKPESMVMIIARVMGSLALIIALILVVAFLVKKGGLAGSSKVGGNGSMDLLEQLPLGTNRSLTLVRVLDSVYLLSQTPSSINMLEKISGDKAIELIASTKGGVSIAHFKDVFDNFMGRIRKSS